MSTRPHQRRMWAGGLLVIAVIAGASTCWTKDQNRESEAEAPRAGQTVYPPKPGVPVAIDPVPLPAFERVTVQGDTFRTSQQSGRVLVVNFWATWCAPCVREIPELVSLQATLEDSGLSIVGVSLDHQGFEVIRPFIEPFEPNYPLVLDEGLSEAFGGVYGLPATFLVDRRGRIVRRIDGLIKPDLLLSEVRSLLATEV